VPVIITNTGKVLVFIVTNTGTVQYSTGISTPVNQGPYSCGVNGTMFSAGTFDDTQLAGVNHCGVYARRAFIQNFIDSKSIINVLVADVLRW